MKAIKVDVDAVEANSLNILTSAAEDARLSAQPRYPIMQAFPQTSICNSRAILVLSVFLLLLIAMCAKSQETTGGSSSLPRTWVDPQTGHKITRISDEPNAKALPFYLNAYTPDHKDMIYTSPLGIYDVNMTSFEVTKIVDGSFVHVMLGTKTRRIFYMKNGSRDVFTLDLDTQESKRIATLPKRGFITSINADETLLSGTNLEGKDPDLTEDKFEAEAEPGHKSASETRETANAMQDIFTVSISTGQVQPIFQSTNWLVQILFSPVDPKLLMYQHGGPASNIDRLWIMNSDGSGNRMLGSHDKANTIVSHAIWSADGKGIWYNLQEPNGGNYYLAGYDLASGRVTRLAVNKASSSTEYSSSSSSDMFCGGGAKPMKSDPSDPNSPMLNRKWIELYYRVPSSSSSVVGNLLAEPLVDMSGHRSFTGTRFSPDNKFVIFTTNVLAKTYLFAVEIAKSKTN